MMYICFMATIKFFIQSKNNPAGIYVRLREGVSVDAKAKTKFAINPSNWSATKGQPKNLKNEGFKKLHEDLASLRNTLLNHYNKSVGKYTINTQWLKDFINPPQQVGTIPTKLVPYFDYYSLHKKNAIGTTTYKRNRVYKHLIERFEKSAKRNFFIKDVNADFKLKFEEYCLKENYAHNTIARTIKFIKTICYHARNNGIETHFQLNNIVVKLEKVEKVFLSIDELKQIEKTKFEADYLQNAKDWLLISCETGQRVSDFLRFTKEQIRYENKKPLIEFTQVKTNKIMTVPLSRKVMEILKKRKGNFPRQITDQRYNEYIKEVCKLAGLTQKVKGSRRDPETERKETGIFEKWQLVTSHIGRRSFATNNYGRVPTSLLIGATGHSTEKMFLEYIGKTDTQKAMQLAEYF
ncbi:MAG: integrase [Bacteroidetes bacterium]|nr:MAG: integrase [Bacteroidota bacterium]